MLRLGLFIISSLMRWIVDKVPGAWVMRLRWEAEGVAGPTEAGAGPKFNCGHNNSSRSAKRLVAAALAHRVVTCCMEYFVALTATCFRPAWR